MDHRVKPEDDGEGTARCSDYGSGEDACICVSNIDDETHWACFLYGCIESPEEKIVKCAEEDGGMETCACITDIENKDSWACSDAACIDCPNGIPACPTWGNCTCCPNGTDVVCSNSSCHCILDAEDEESWECNSADCIDCPGGLAKCPSTNYGYGDCVCLN